MSDTDVDPVDPVDPAPADPAPADPAPADPAPNGEGGDNVVWPENWRDQMAGGDEKKLDRLGRFDQPGKILDSYIELEQKFKSSDIRTPFPDEGTDAEKALWRESNAVPNEAAGYFGALPEGLVIGEDDKPGMEIFAAEMHAANASEPVAHAAIGAYYKIVEGVMADMAEADKQGEKACTDTLNEVYSGEYRRNMNDMNAWLDSGGGEMRSELLSARKADGTMLGNDPAFMQFMVGQMRTMNPYSTIPGLGAGDPVAAMSEEIAKIEQVMANDNKAYVADKPMQERYLALITARDKNK